MKFFEKINKTDKSLAILKKQTQITKIKNERGNITINVTEIQNYIYIYIYIYIYFTRNSYIPSN